MKDRKKIVEAVFFVTVTVLALSVLFRGQNWHSLFLLVRKSNPVCLLFAVFLGLLFVCMEGYMIWRLLRLSGNDATLPGCIRYSFVGYFYSGITPSATGGQPAQLYEMCKDGNNASDSTVVLMVVALFYKLVLVVIGLMLPVVWLGHMKEYLGLTPGSVSIMGLMNDPENHVKLLIDSDVLKDEYFGCHPCINTTSMKLKTSDIMEKFLPAVHHEPTIVDLPWEE